MILFGLNPPMKSTAEPRRISRLDVASSQIEIDRMSSDDRERAITRLLRDDPGASISAIAYELGMTSERAGKTLHAMRDKGLIRFEEHGKRTIKTKAWFLTDE